jgi:hypothetical protein
VKYDAEYAVHYGFTDLQPAAGFTVVIKGDKGCDGKGKRKMWWMQERLVENCWRPSVHEDCQCNEHSSLMLRTMGAFPPPTRINDMLPSYQWLRRVSRNLRCSRATRQEIVDSYSGLLRARYEKAMISLEEEPLSVYHDSRLKPFLKAEKFNSQLKMAKPRMIMPRSPRYNLELARYLKPLEHELWGRLRSPRRWGVGASRVVAKGLNQTQRANLILRKFRGIRDVVVVEVDGAQFEAHVTRQVLMLEHSVYRAKFADPRLKNMLDAQLELKGTTSHGIKFQRPGARASGDVNTGMGNSIVMLAAVDTTMTELSGGRFPFDLLVDGDNALLFFPREHLEFVRANFRRTITEVSGQEATIDGEAFIPEHITFGQCQPVQITENSWTMVRNPWKVISNSFSGYRQWDKHLYACRVSKSIAQCELSLAQGVPVLQPYFLHSLRHFDKYRESSDDSVREMFYLGARRMTTGRPITALARSSFELAFGIGVRSQQALELLRPCFRETWEGNYHGSNEAKHPFNSSFTWLKPHREEQ